jgi:hypothetical protein
MVRGRTVGNKVGSDSAGRWNVCGRARALKHLDLLKELSFFVPS